MSYVFLIKKNIKFLKKYFLEICLELFNDKFLKLKKNKKIYKKILTIKNILNLKKNESVSR